MPSDDPSRSRLGVDLVPPFYAAARAEIELRLKQRDQAMLLYMAAAGVIFGAAFGQGDAQPVLLTLIPLLGYGVVTIIGQHQKHIEIFDAYVAIELRSYVMSSGANVPPQMEHALALESPHRNAAFSSRRASYLVLIAAPAFAIAAGCFVFCDETWAWAPAAASLVAGSLTTLAIFETTGRIDDAREWTRKALADAHDENSLAA